MPSGAAVGDVRPPPGFEDAEDPQREKPWVPKEEEECQFKCCQTCRPTCAQRSYLSLDGIANDDIPPSAASGFGFHLLGARPIMDADVLQNLGYRPVPLVCLHKYFPISS